MNNKIIVLWGAVVFGLVASIYIIGITESRREDYTEYKKELKACVEDYLTDTNSWPSESNTTVVDIEDLHKYNYLESLKYNDRVCTGTIKVTKEKKDYNYEYDIECVKEIA